MNVREWALPVYTILMQLAIGAFFVLWMIRYAASSKFSHQEIDRIIRNPMLVIAVTAAVAMGGAHLHLSKPFHSFLAVLNFKSSWLSREIVFTLCFFLTTMSLMYLTYFQRHRRGLVTAIGWLAILFGFILIYCMARIYLIPTQMAWNSSSVIISFYTTALILGSLAIMCLLVLDLKFAEIQKADDVELRSQVVRDCASGLTSFAIVLVIISVLISYLQMRFLAQGGIIARMSFNLLMEPYLPLLLIRLALLISVSLYLAYAVSRMYKLKSTPQSLMLSVYLSCLLIIVGEILGRFLFYAVHIRVGL